MRKFKYAAALALVASMPVFAQEEAELEEEGVIGWTPVAIGLATPVQLPWGINRWDVFGIDLNVFYSDAPKMYGIDVGGLAELTRDTAIGLLVGGLANVSFEDVYGLRATLGLNYGQKGIYGMEVGLVGVRDSLHGCDVQFLGTYQREVCGLQISGLANVATVESYGMNVAGLANLAKTAYGLQLALLFNMTEELHGAQIALVNYTEDCPSGFQIGLVNIILQNKLSVLPIVNGYF
jgi:hypothetical protein